MRRHEPLPRTAEANRWNVGKVIVGFLFLVCLSRTILALAALGGAPAPVNAFPQLADAPAKVALYYGAAAIALAAAFRWLETRRRARRAE